MSAERKTNHGTSQRTKEASYEQTTKPDRQHQVASSSSSLSSSAVSANWKTLAKQLGLDTACRQRDKVAGSGTSTVKASTFNPKSRKRKKSTTEVLCPKRRKMDRGNGSHRGGGTTSLVTKKKQGAWLGGGSEHSLQGDTSDTSVSLITGRDTSLVNQPPIPQRWMYCITSSYIQRCGIGGWFTRLPHDHPLLGDTNFVVLPTAGRCVSMDCEMVGTGSEGDFSMLARCSIVNHHGNILYDSYVAPMDKITDYRTKVSGITPQHLREAPDFKIVQREVSELIKGRILVGHAIHHDLKALLLSHPWKDVRDTSKFKCFRQLSKGKTPSLKKLAKEVLEITIQRTHHDSVEDARVAMRLYQMHKKQWEALNKSNRRKKRH